MKKKELNLEFSNKNTKTVDIKENVNLEAQRVTEKENRQQK